MKRVKHGRAMGIAPNKAAESFAEAKEGAAPSAKQVSGFVLQDRAAEDREHNREVQNKARDNWQTPRTKPSVLKYHRVPRKAASTALETQNIQTRCIKSTPQQDSVDSEEGRC